MEKPILTDPLTEPADAVLENALGENFKVYAKCAAEINARGFIMEWRYYNDGKSWLCKILRKKKNLAWLSVWNTGFKLTFYFPERIAADIQKLDIDGEIKKAAKESKPSGKTRPVILAMNGSKNIPDAVKLLEYKMSLN